MKHRAAIFCLQFAVALAQPPGEKKDPVPPVQQAPQGVVGASVVELGALSAKRGDSVLVFSAADLTGGEVTLAGTRVAAVVQGKALLITVPPTQPLGPAAI